MATKAKPKKTMKKQHTPDYYPVQRRIPLGTPSALPAGPNVGDTAKLLSIMNRRLYRYGMKYEIKIDLETQESIAAPYEFQVFALSNTWDTQRAFALAKETFDAAHADELGKSGVVAARWRDFRCFHGVTGAAELDPVVYDTATLAAQVQNVGEHAVSSVDVGGVDTEFSWSSTGGRLNILTEWQNAGRTDTEPANKVTNAPYDGVNADDLSNNEYTNLQNDGDSPPYAVFAASDQWVRVGTLRVDAPVGMQRQSTGYFDAPCGLFVIVNTSPGGASMPNGIVSCTVKAGEYKGVLADKMCQ